MSLFHTHAPPIIHTFDLTACSSRHLLVVSTPTDTSMKLCPILSCVSLACFWKLVFFIEFKFMVSFLGVSPTSEGACMCLRPFKVPRFSEIRLDSILLMVQYNEHGYVITSSSFMHLSMDGQPYEGLYHLIFLLDMVLILVLFCSLKFLSCVFRVVARV